jgi:hypothetical protein
MCCNFIGSYLSVFVLSLSLFYVQSCENTRTVSQIRYRWSCSIDWIMRTKVLLECFILYFFFITSWFLTSVEFIEYQIRNASTTSPRHGACFFLVRMYEWIGKVSGALIICCVEPSCRSESKLTNNRNEVVKGNDLIFMSINTLLPWKVS